MESNDTLARALADVSERRAALEAEYERIAAELMKVHQAERALRAIVEGVPLEEAAPGSTRVPGRASPPETPRASGRGPRGPRANSAKGRLRALLDSAGQQGLSHAELTERLPAVASATLNAYLSAMVTSGEAMRVGEFYKGQQSDQQEPSEQDTEAGRVGAEGIAPRSDPDEEAAAAE